MYERKDKWTVGYWMTPNPTTVSSDTLARTAFLVMRTEGFRHLPVVDDGKLVGVVTDRDLRRPDLSTEPEGWLEYYNLDSGFEVGDVMTTNPITVTPSDRIEKALKSFVSHKFGALPVLDKKGAVIGVISTLDMMKAFSEVMDLAASHLK